MNVLDCIGMNLYDAVNLLKANYPSHRITKNWIEGHDDILRIQEFSGETNIIVIGYRKDNNMVVIVNKH
jgi:hypothetical protein